MYYYIYIYPSCDRQTDRPIDRQVDRQIDRHTKKFKNRNVSM